MSIALATLMIFVQLSDPQFGWYADLGFVKEKKCMRSVATYVNSIKPTFVIVTGDMVDAHPHSRDRAHQVRHFKLAMKKIQAKVMYVAGNQDVGNQPTPDMIDQFWTEFGPDMYAFKVAGNSYLVLNSTIMRRPQSSKKKAEDRWKLAEKVIKAEKPVAIFAHHPLFRFAHDEVDNYFNWPSKQRGRLLKLLKGSSVKWFITGHTHLPWEIEHNGMKIFTAGSATSPRLDSQPELVQWTVSGKELIPKRIRLSCLKKGKK